jgi:NAD-dependent deacetylase
MKKIAIFTGAGVSAESGVATFRTGNDALWEGHSIEEVATLDGWRQNREVVLDFYNARRSELPTVEPNAAHKALAQLEEKYDVTIVTQNVDDLHERAGSSKVLHLHGELTKARGAMYNHKPSPLDQVYDIGYEDIKIGDKCEHTDSQLRPHIVWFGEMPFNVDEAAFALSEADIVMVIGTSLQIGYTIPLIGDTVKASAEVYYIDPEPAKYLDQYGLQMTYITEPATKGVTDLVNILNAREDATQEV